MTVNEDTPPNHFVNLTPYTTFVHSSHSNSTTHSNLIKAFAQSVNEKSQQIEEVDETLPNKVSKVLTAPENDSGSDDNEVKSQLNDSITKNNSASFFQHHEVSKQAAEVGNLMLEMQGPKVG